MKIAVLSDIHSNSFALSAVIKEFGQNEIEKIIVAGDIFGYYPWARETYELLQPYIDSAWVIKGNHDQLLLDSNPPVPIPSYWDAAKQNEASLREFHPEALQWVQQLSYSLNFEAGNKKITLIHGSPDNNPDGRFYPDDDNDHTWFPESDEILILGHTHYPILKTLPGKGTIINPGSVGQPRDGNPMPSWVLLDTLDFSVKFMRTNYDNLAVMDLLTNINWEERAIRALNKRKSGHLD